VLAGLMVSGLVVSSLVVSGRRPGSRSGCRAGH